MPKKKYQRLGAGMTPSKTELGKFLRTHRIELGLRQIQVAKLSGMTQSLYSALEVGKRQYLKPKRLESLSEALQCEPSQLQTLISKKRHTEPKTELGKFIRSRREQLGLTLEDFSKRLKITLQRAKSLEVGKWQSIQYRLLKPLAKALDLELSTLSNFVGITAKTTNSSLGQLVRSRRKELGLSIIQFAKKLRVSRQFASQIELGLCPLSRNDAMIERLARVLKLEVAELQAVRPKRRLKCKITEPTTLGGFLAARRLELHLLQREVAERAETEPSVISTVETNQRWPGPKLLDKLAKTLECEVPSELIRANKFVSL